MTSFPPRPITLETVAVAEDADELWRAFLDANHSRDLVLADAIRVRLAALQRSRTASDLDDDQLKAQIITLRPPGVADPLVTEDLSSLLEEARRRGIEV